MTAKAANWLGYLAVAALLAGLTITVEQVRDTGSPQLPFSLAQECNEQEHDDHLCNNTLTVRAYVDRGGGGYCQDRFFQEGIDIRVGGAEVKLTLPDGSTQTQQLTDSGYGNFQDIDFTNTANQTVTVAITYPDPFKFGGNEYALSECSNSRGATRTLEASNFSSFGFKLVEFRAEMARKEGPTETPAPTAMPTDSERVCKKIDQTPLLDCRQPEVNRQPTNITLTHNSDATFTVNWTKIDENALPEGVTLKEYRLSIVRDDIDRAWIGYPTIVRVDPDQNSYTSKVLEEDLRGKTFYARVRAIYDDRLLENQDNCVCRSHYSESSKVSTPGPTATPTLTPSPTPVPTSTPTLTPTPTPAQGGPGPGYQPGVCKGEACYSPAAPQVSVYKNLSIGGVNFVFSEAGAGLPASKYSLRWATADNFDNPNHTRTECCNFDQCTGEQSCGSREACTGNESAEQSFNPVCDGNQCVFERGGLSPCVEYKAEIVAQVNTASCPTRGQAVSNEMSFLYSDGNCDGREHFGPAPQPQPTDGSVTPVPTLPPSARCDYPQSGACSPDNLVKYFRDDAQKSARQKAVEAAQVCLKDSSAQRTAVNDQCLPPSERDFRTDTDSMTPDYSIGYFQINVINECREGLQSYCPNLGNCPGATDPGGSFRYCRKVSNGSEALEECRKTYLNPENNFQRMVEKSRGGYTWRPWNWAACQCGLPGCETSALATNVTGDNYIDAADVAVVMSAYGSQEGEADYSSKADFCGPSGEGVDGVINAYEISCLIRDWSPRR